MTEEQYNKAGSLIRQIKDIKDNIENHENVNTMRIRIGLN